MTDDQNDPIGSLGLGVGELRIADGESGMANGCLGSAVRFVVELATDLGDEECDDFV